MTTRARWEAVRGGRCVCCREEGSELRTCDGCRTLLHEECALALGTCPTLGCAASATRPSRPHASVVLFVYVVAGLWVEFALFYDWFDAFYARRGIDAVSAAGRDVWSPLAIMVAASRSVRSTWAALGLLAALSVLVWAATHKGSTFGRSLRPASVVLAVVGVLALMPGGLQFLDWIVTMT